MILEKKRAQYIITIVEDKDEPWFMYVIRTDKKTNEFKSKSMIIRKDLPDWIKWFEGNGWILKENRK